MTKKILIGLGILVTLITALAIFGVYYFKPSRDVIVDFIKHNPDRAAIKLVVNDTVLVAQNPDKVMPLASTVKIIIAIEYAIQAANGTIDADQEVPLEELDKYYVARTDGGAHTGWLKSVKSISREQKISIHEIAKGMIRYSSNANTEWMMDKLGVDNINSRLDSLGLRQHEEIYYIVSSLFVGKEKFPDEKEQALEEKLRALDLENYRRVAQEVHQKLLTDTTYKKNLGELGMNIQRIWSDNLPGATVAEYVSIMEKINSRTYFSAETHRYLNEVMEYVMENPANREWLKHSGMKGGSTAFALTKSLYATDKKGNKITMAYFLDGLGPIEGQRLKMSMNEFELNVLSKKDFRKTLQKELPNN